VPLMWRSRSNAKNPRTHTFRSSDARTGASTRKSTGTAPHQHQIRTSTGRRHPTASPHVWSPCRCAPVGLVGGRDRGTVVSAAVGRLTSSLKLRLRLRCPRSQARRLLHPCIACTAEHAHQLARMVPSPEIKILLCFSWSLAPPLCCCFGQNRAQFGVHSACIFFIPLGRLHRREPCLAAGGSSLRPVRAVSLPLKFSEAGPPDTAAAVEPGNTPGVSGDSKCARKRGRGNEGGGGRASRLPHRCPTVAVLSLSVCVLPVRPSGPAPPRATIPDLHSHPHQRTSAHPMHDS